jgi:amino acid permease
MEEYEMTQEDENIELKSIESQTLALEPEQTQDLSPQEEILSVEKDDPVEYWNFMEIGFQIVTSFLKNLTMFEKIKEQFSKLKSEKIIQNILKFQIPPKIKLFTQTFVSIIIFLFTFIYIFILCCFKVEKFLNLAGICGFIFFLFLFSTNQKKINWRTISWGFFLQFLFGLLILRTTVKIKF